jgi:hypothetical protein
MSRHLDAERTVRTVRTVTASPATANTHHLTAKEIET